MCFFITRVATVMVSVCTIETVTKTGVYSKYFLAISGCLKNTAMSHKLIL